MTRYIFLIYFYIGLNMIKCIVNDSFGNIYKFKKKINLGAQI